MPSSMALRSSPECFPISRHRPPPRRRPLRAPAPALRRVPRSARRAMRRSPAMISLTACNFTPPGSAASGPVRGWNRASSCSDSLSIWGARLVFRPAASPFIHAATRPAAGVHVSSPPSQRVEPASESLEFGHYAVSPIVMPARLSVSSASFHIRFRALALAVVGQHRQPVLGASASRTCAE